MGTTSGNLLSSNVPRGQNLKERIIEICSNYEK
jgi:hypothetical protein